MDYYYKQPRYMEKFACIGGECPESCCDGWTIEWTAAEVERLKAANMSEELKNRVNKSFKPSSSGLQKIVMVTCVELGDENKNLDVLKTRFRCPFHDSETGLCSIQRELGEKYLSGTCRFYPRKYVAFNNILLRSCGASCPAVLDLIFNDKRSMEIIHTPVRDFGDINANAHGRTIQQKDIDNYPVFRYLFDITDFYCDLMQNPNNSIYISLIIGALAAKHISDALERREHERIPKIIKELKAQLNSPSMSRSLNDISPNLDLQFKLVSNMIVKFFGVKCEEILDLSALHDGTAVIEENYLRGMENFNKTFEGREFALKNVIINTFLDTMIHLNTFDCSFFDRYSYFVMCSAVFKIAAAVIGFTRSNIENDFRSVISIMSRLISHNVSGAKEIMDDMKATGLTSPAHLALIIK